MNIMEISAVVFEIDNGNAVKRVEDTSPEIIDAWNQLRYASVNGSNSECDGMFYTLENLYITKYGTDCEFLGEVKWKV